MKLIEYLYGEHYHIHKLLVDVEDVGHSGTRRERVYIILAHKTRTIQLLDPKALYFAISSEIKSRISTRPSDYFVSNRTEVILAAQELAFKRKKVFKESWF